LFLLYPPTFLLLFVNREKRNVRTMVLPSEDEEADVKAKHQENEDSGVDGADDQQEEEQHSGGNRGGVEEGKTDNDDDGNDDDNEVEDDNVDTSKENSTTIQPPKPVKRARLAYSIFCDEKRPEMQEEVSVRDNYPGYT
jgi:hypothetical protein